MNSGVIVQISVGENSTDYYIRHLVTARIDKFSNKQCRSHSLSYSEDSHAAYVAKSDVELL